MGLQVFSLPGGRNGSEADTRFTAENELPVWRLGYRGQALARSGQARLEAASAVVRLHDHAALADEQDPSIARDRACEQRCRALCAGLLPVLPAVGRAVHAAAHSVDE